MSAGRDPRGEAPARGPIEPDDGGHRPSPPRGPGDNDDDAARPDRPVGDFGDDERADPGGDSDVRPQRDG